MHQTPSRSPATAPRRDFLWSLGAVVVGGVVGVVGVLSGVWTFLDPLARRTRLPLGAGSGSGPGEGYYRITALSAVPEDGVPRRYPVLANQVDAWNYTPNQPIGAVYLRRVSGGELQVFHSTCPHAGCSVSPVGTAFHCPCHNSSFNFDGQREARPGKKNPSPRDLDQLEYKVVDGDVWIEFKDFYTGREEKTAKI